MMNRVKTESEITAMRTGGQILAQVLEFLKPQTVAGITTGELSGLAASETKRLGGGTPILGYEGYPEPICICINDEVVHGIPGDRVVRDGDIVSFDFCVSYDGMITDAATTIGVGAVSKEAKRLMHATADSLALGIKAAQAGIVVDDISGVIEDRLRRDKLGVVEALCGHGVGHGIHEDPEIPNFRTGYPGPKLLAGMTIAIEPMATLGHHAVRLAPDRWTFKTVDGSLSAQFEHTILITDRGSEILTKA
ncbi:MAG TPA: type I methionyl aminopeptidase [Candidatus Saccharimonadales bacterium]|nr:type I methionyl aminopeptidase [Candidatus Saccharimonadales bacterium]